MLQLPFFAELEGARRILLAGAGGGFDLFCGLPLYHGLCDSGKEVFLANLSFTRLDQVGGRRWTPALVEVDADTPGPTYINYFPEGYLCQWYRQVSQEVSVYCLERTGVVPLVEAYQFLVKHLQVDTVILVDGGTDSLMRGDEFDLGTPHEDIASIAAVDELQLDRKLMVCLGFGIDHYHGICHAHFLEAVAELTRVGGFLGTFSLLADMPEVERYRLATQAVFNRMPNHVSIVSSSILSALEGHYGDHHATPRTAGSRLWINPLMALYWCFRLEPVARRILYLDELKQTSWYGDVDDVIGRFRGACRTIRPWTDIPV
jgi:hypothetical protein